MFASPFRLAPVLVLSCVALGGPAWGAPDARYPLVIDAPRGEWASARQLVPERDVALAPSAPPSALAQSRIIYLNKAGVTLQPGASNDSRQNRSTIAQQPTLIPPWSVSETAWTDTVACVREIFAPFAVRVVTEDPGAAPHIEAVFGGTPQLLGLSRSIAGISPFTASCAVIEHSMVFVFTGAFTASPRTICEVMAQEIAHSYGLDHELVAADPMSYLSFDGRRAFQEQLASCGEYAPRTCGIGATPCRAMQSSLLLLRERLGVADAIPPQGKITWPAADAVVESSFLIEAAATDNIAIAEISFSIDGEAVGQALAPPYRVAVRSVAAGERSITAMIVDQARNTTRITSTVTVVPADDSGLLPGCHAARPSASALCCIALAPLGWRRRRRR